MNRAERRRRTHVIIERRRKKLKNYFSTLYIDNPINTGDLREGELRNNNIMNASTNGGVAKKSKAKHGHSSYRHKGTYGPAINYPPNDQRQIDSFNEQLKGDK